MVFGRVGQIMECQDRMGQKVLPVFYHVDPSDVREQKGNFATAFQQHKDKFKVKQWREALTAAASLSGYPISSLSGGESTSISKIVQEIFGGIQPRGREKNLIGIESHIDALISLLNVEAAEQVRIIGILGMGGIGKTTIARALFIRIAYKFEGCSFIKDVRENGSSKADICTLQENMLSDILVAHHGFKIRDPEYGADMIQERLCNKKVLLVLDDVDDLKQLEFLAATHEWFGPGSRIIITTRDEHLLSDANAKYKPALLRMDQAVDLFSRHAFRESNPPGGFEELSVRAIRYAGRLPLALKVLGSFLRGRQAGVWESALDRLAKTPHMEIFETLKLSFDGLEESEKKIFLDIACFYKGSNVKYVTRIFESLGFHPGIGIESLIEKSLITISKGRIDMHDLIQEMGWQIIYDSAPNSRLWQPEKLFELIKKNKELEEIEAIVVRAWYYDVGLGFSTDVFENMKNLRLLDVYAKFTSCQPTFLPEELKWLRWKYYPFPSLPVENMRKIVALKIELGKIEHLWKGQKIMWNLKFIHLLDCGCLLRFPDVSGAPNIEMLILSRCENLVEVHESLVFLKRLVYLDMSDCGKLKFLPSTIETESLETLILSDCTSLERLPEFSLCMVKLSHIDFGSCFRIEELPSSIRHLSRLSFLNLNGCTSLTNIPNSICELKSLKTLHLHGCWKLRKLPNEFGRMENLEELHIGQTESINFRALTNLCFLRKLDLSWCLIGDEDFPQNLHGFSALEELNLRDNHELIRLPTSFSHLSRLKYLELNGCRRLQNLHGLPSGIQVLKASYCSSLEKIEDLAKEHEWLYNIWLFGCTKLLQDQETEKYLDNMLQQPFLLKCAAVEHYLSLGIPGSKIPNWFKEQRYGCEIALHLLPKWKSQITGFAICGVFKNQLNYDHPCIEFRLVNDGAFIITSAANNINDSSATDNGDVWVGCIPFAFFEKMHNDDDFEGDDWTRIMEGNLVIHVSSSSGEKAVHCAAQVLFKEDVESIQQVTHVSISSYDWKLSHLSPNTIQCE